MSTCGCQVRTGISVSLRDCWTRLGPRKTHGEVQLLSGSGLRLRLRSQGTEIWPQLKVPPERGTGEATTTPSLRPAGQRHIQERAEEAPLRRGYRESNPPHKAAGGPQG